MCGITGYYSPSGRFTGDLLRVANEKLSHRGPDAGGIFTEGIAGLGHRRLSIIDLSENANQPMFSTNGRFVIVFNGEVYNFKEIKLEILNERPGFQFKTNSDTEVILEAFSIWREQIANKLNGMFAIAIYDKEEGSLFLLRDRIGIKPIYYYWDGKDFFFASELKAIKALGKAINFELNKEALPYFFHLGFIPEPHSIYKNIYKFPSGHYLILNRAQLLCTPYWEPTAKIEHEKITNEHTAKKQLKELITSSVRYRMISDVSFGTFLSGGVDSSLVTAVAQSISNEPVKTFSIGFSEQGYSESEFAAQVSKYLKTDHHTFEVSQQDALDMVAGLDEIYDEPFAETSSIPTLLVSKLARKYVTMTLSGDGGDELFMGYGEHIWAQRLSNPIYSLMRKPIAMALDLGDQRMKRAAQHFKAYSVLNYESNIFSQEQNFFFEKELSLLLCQNITDNLNFTPRHGNLKRTITPVEKQAIFDLMVYLKDDLLVKVDRATMKYSLETRVPLLDYRIVEFALNLDQSLKIKGKTAKYLLKEVLYDYIPREYFNRPKKGFSIPLHKWLRKDLKQYADTYITKSMCERYGIVNWSYAERVLHCFYKEGLDFYFNRVWAILCIHKYMEANY